MSEPPGPDWWQASDGNWYAPELHPSVRRDPPAPPPTGPPLTHIPVAGRVGAHSAPKSGRAHARLLVATSALVLVVGVGGILVVASPSKPRPSGTSRSFTPASRPATPATSSEADPPIIPNPPVLMSALDLLGGPTAADGRLLVIDVTVSRQLQLSAINPATGTVAWQRPFSASDIAPGESFAPTTFGDLVIDLAPYGPAGSMTVSVLGVEISTGDVAWKFGQPGVTEDAPAACAATTTTLCLSWNAQSSSPLIEIDATDGSLIRAVGAVERGLGTDVYQTIDPSPTLLQIGDKGQLLWQRSAASIFGSVNDQPDYGWNVQPFGALDVGSLGSKPVGRVYNLGSATTTGFTIATGRPVWTDIGDFNCQLYIFTAPMLCRITGTATETSSGGSSLKGVTVTLEGFDPTTGKITWRQADDDPAPFTADGELPFVDARHLVVRRAGVDVVLDAASGTVAPLAKGQVLWCSTQPFVKVTGPKGSGYEDERIATEVFSSCNAAGVAVAGHPTNQPSVVGVTLDGRFFWPTEHGLAEAQALKARPS